MNYSEEDLDKIARNIVSGIDKEIEEEKEFDELSVEIASKCLASNDHSCRYPYLGIEYIWEVYWDIPKYNPETRKYEFGCLVVCTDIVKKNIGNGKYIPLTAHAPYEDEKAERNTLAATIVKSILKHKAGKDFVVQEM